MAAPPMAARVSVRFTVTPVGDLVTKAASRVALTRWARVVMAQSRLFSSQWSEPGARYFTFFRRLGLVTPSKTAWPLLHRDPWLMGWSGSPSTLMSLPPLVWAMRPQPTPQKGQMEVVTWVSLVLAGCTAPAHPERVKTTPERPTAVMPLPKPLINVLRVIPIFHLMLGLWSSGMKIVGFINYFN